jgi:mycothiol synthase
MQALAAAFPGRTVHVADLPYRLASPALVSDPERDTALWWTADGSALVAWAVWQTPWVTLDYAVHPEHASGVGGALLAWAEARFAALARERGTRLPYWVAARESDADRIALLERAGYLPAEKTTVRRRRPLAEPRPAAQVPEGFCVRPLRGDEEVEAYISTHRAAFGSSATTAEWRRRVLRMPEYRPDLDLIAEAPGGRIAGFTILWLAASQATGDVEAQFEPVGTQPDFQRRGLGRALLQEGMRRAREAGATHAVVEADSGRGGARPLYESLMPAPDYTILHYSKFF